MHLTLRESITRSAYGMVNTTDPDTSQAASSGDQPKFVLCGGDPQAADLVRLWAEGRDFLKGAGDRQVMDARRIADAMEQWCVRQGKNPVHALSLLPFELLASELRRRGAKVTPGQFDDDLDS